MTTFDPSQQPIAVVGVSALFPGSVEREGFWRNILAGTDLITDVPEGHWRISDYFDEDPSARDKVYAKRGGFLPKVPFDPMGWGVPPTILPATDTNQLLALVVAQRVLDDAIAGEFGEELRARTSVILGVTSAQELLGTMVSRLQRPVWSKALREMGLDAAQVDEACDRIAGHYVEWQESTFPGVLGNVVAGRIANRLDLGGTNCVTDAACASSFSALAMGIQELRLGASDLVLAGGADTMNDIFMYMCFSKTPALSPTGDCRPFSDRADGTLLGEGLAMFALKRMADAEAAGDKIYAVIRGVGSSSDGRAKSVYAPVPEGQARALRRAYAQAGYGPGTVELLEAHGTGTKAGDAAEFAGLVQVFEPARDEARRDRWCALGTVKSQVGHTKAAAGAAGLFKAVMALHHRALPPTIKVDAPNPALNIDESPFYLNDVAKPWVGTTAHPRRAGVSSFGFGGSNFHVTVEEHRGARAPRLRSLPEELVLLHAPTAEALVERCREVRETAAQPGALRWLARTTQQNFDPRGARRLAVRAADDEQLRQKLDNAVAMVADDRPFRSPTGVTYGTDRLQGDLGLVFSGQGSQYLGMGGALAMAFDRAIDAWDLAEARVPGLAETVFPLPTYDDAASDAQRARLRATEWAQPAIGAVALAQWRMLQALGVRPQAVAGHSFGELMALHAAGSLDAAGVLDLARRRGELMAEAARASDGAMVSVRGSREEIEPLLEGVSVVLANHNGPRQVVLSGPRGSLNALAPSLEDKGLRCTWLDVATAFHSPVVADAVTPLREALAAAEVAPPRLEVFSNTRVDPYPSDADAVRAQLAAQLAAPVRWVEQIEAMYASGVRTFVEVGPGHVLSSLVGRVLGDRAHLTVALDRRGRDSTTTFLQGLADLAVAGVALSWDAWWEGYAEPEDPAAKTKPRMTVELTGTSYGKKYPDPDGVQAAPKPVAAATPDPEARPTSPMPTPARPTPARSTPMATTTPVATPRPKPVTTPTPTSAPNESPSPMTKPKTNPNLTGGLVHAFELAQRQAAAAQAQFQRTLAESHESYLRESRASFAMLLQAVGADAGARIDALDAPRAPAVHAAEPRTSTPTAPVVAAPREEPPPPSAIDAPEPTPSPASPTEATVDLTETMLAVVAEATGYPAEMLGLDMDLEADLGIDSIKRVEILSALRRRVPTLPDVPAAEVGQLRTLGAVLERYGHGAPAPALEEPPSAPQDPREGLDVTALVLDAVADKTGYPVDMLGLEMSLEADLGIDSIKRVEILSAVRQRRPDLPEVAAAEMGSLQTLGAVIERLAVAIDGAAPRPSADPNPSPAETRPGGPPRRRIPRRIERPLSGWATPQLREVDLAITEDGAGLASALQHRLAEAGIDSRLVAHPGELREADGLILLASADEALAASRLALTHARAIAGRARLLVTVQHTGGDFTDEEDAAGASLVGLGRTARHEWPEATVRCLDVARDTVASMAERIADELLRGGTDPDVGRTDGGRWVLLDEDVAATTEGPTGVGPDDVVVASGGGRGVTAAALIALARASGGRYALLGRTALVDETGAIAAASDERALKAVLVEEHRRRGETPTPAAIDRQVREILAGREVRRTLAALEDAGAQATYVSVDVTDEVSVSERLAEVRAALGPIRMLVHGAGVLADKRIEDKTDAQIARVFGPKVRGLDALLAATEGDPLHTVCLFSSVAARFGNAGQSDYAMANQMLHARAHAMRRRQPDLRVRAMAWGPWRGGMVNPALAAHFEAAGVQLIIVDHGAEAFVNELRADADVVEVLLGDGFGAPSPRPLAHDVLVRESTHRALVDHAVDGQAVLPVAAAVERMVSALHEAYPELHVVRLSSVRVLRGVVLDRFAEGTWLRVELEQQRNGDGATVGVSLVDGDGRPRYRAVAELAPHPQPLEGWGPAPSGESLASPYGDVLFHGPRFQVLGDARIGREGATASIVGGALGELGRAVDVGALDGALQLALLWTAERTGGRALPTAIEHVQLHGAPLEDGPVEAVLTAVVSESTRAVCDVALRRGDTVFCILRGVETHCRPTVEHRARP